MGNGRLPSKPPTQWRIHVSDGDTASSRRQGTSVGASCTCGEGPHSSKQCKCSAQSNCYSISAGHSTGRSESIYSIMPRFLRSAGNDKRLSSIESRFSARRVKHLGWNICFWINSILGNFSKRPPSGGLFAFGLQLPPAQELARPMLRSHPCPWRGAALLIRHLMRVHDLAQYHLCRLVPENRNTPIFHDIVR